MKSSSLATTYRPQTFSDVAGQELIVKVLSNSVAQDNIAPGYLLSGTRGVGKTTIARIFAKTINCVNAPCAEPCNKCDQCLKITQGIHVDVHEIDGASNNKVEDARALREHIGYAPMEGRYKIFIIDEAHMLTPQAFNAMLKTLEEPPPRVVFIFASTEAHKFPITIVSRCQHFVLKRLSEAQIVRHLTKIIQLENVQFEPEAIKLISKRACGSVRDGMSLLGQSLALGSDILNAKSVRSVLGMASLDMYNSLIDAIVAQNCMDITNILKEMLDEGIDIGFFLNEFTTLWRTLFLLKQDGEKILASLDLSEAEADLWLKQARRLSLTHIHAAWHMVLESQKRITLSQEPTSALELLLLNISLMPKLLPIEKIVNSDELYAQSAQGTKDTKDTPPAQGADGNSNTTALSAKSTQSAGKNADDAALNAQDAGVNITADELKKKAEHSRNVDEKVGLKANAARSLDNTARSLDNNTSGLDTNTRGLDNTARSLDNTAQQNTGQVEIRDVRNERAINDTRNIIDTRNNDDDDDEFDVKHIDLNDIQYMDTRDTRDTRTVKDNIFNEIDNIAKNDIKGSDANAFGQSDTIDAKHINLNTLEYKDNDEQFVPNDMGVAENYTRREYTWEDLYQFICLQNNEKIKKTALGQTQGTFDNNTLYLDTRSTTVYNSIGKMQDIIENLATSFFKQSIKVIIRQPQNLPKSRNELIAEAEEYPEIKNLKELFDAHIEDCQPFIGSK